MNNYILENYEHFKNIVFYLFDENIKSLNNDDKYFFI